MTARAPGPSLLGRLAQDAWPAVAPRVAEELLTTITSTARRLLGAAACSIALLSPDGRVGADIHRLGCWGTG